MACKDDDITMSDEDSDVTKLPQNWPDENSLSCDSVHLIKKHDENAVRLYKRYLLKKSTVYPMTNFPRGNVLVINNERFPPPYERKGSDKDVEKITAVFSQLGFHVIVHHNLTKDEMKKTLSGASKLDYSNHDCFIIFVLSHGDEGIVFGIDANMKEKSNSISVSDITHFFSENKSLLGKPKLFFIQACQGKKEDEGTTLDNEPTIDRHSKRDASTNTCEQADSHHIGPGKNSEGISEDEETTDGPKIPSEADIFVSTATVEGYVSWRNVKIGTWYVQAIGYVFRRFAYKHDLNYLMTLVNNLVSNSETKVKQCKQVAAKYDTLTKMFYFFPCLHEPYVEITDKYQKENGEKKEVKKQLDSVCKKLASRKLQYNQEKERRQILENELKTRDQNIVTLTEQRDSARILKRTLEKELASEKKVNAEEEGRRETLEEDLECRDETIVYLKVQRDNERILKDTLEKELASEKEVNAKETQKRKTLEKDLKCRDETIAKLREQCEQQKEQLQKFQNDSTIGDKPLLLDKTVLDMSTSEDRDQNDDVIECAEGATSLRYRSSESISSMPLKPDRSKKKITQLKNHNTNDIDLLLIGKTGNGKSATGNTILGFNRFESDASCTSVTHTVEYNIIDYNGRSIKVVDGPGVGDTSSIDDLEEATKLVIDKMKDAVLLNPEGYHALLLVVRYGGRFTREDKEMIRILKAIFGSDFVKNYGILVVTCGDIFYSQQKLQRRKNFKTWCGEQQGVFKELLQECDNRALLFDNESKDKKTRHKQMQKLIETVDKLIYEGRRYTNDNFKRVEAMRDLLLVEVKEPVIREAALRKIQVITNHLEDISTGDSDNKLAEIEELLKKTEELLESIHSTDKGSGILAKTLISVATVKNAVFSKLEETKLILKAKFDMAEKIKRN